MRNSDSRHGHLCRLSVSMQEYIHLYQYYKCGKISEKKVRKAARKRGNQWRSCYVSA